jgi:hypothetical protein
MTAVAARPFSVPAFDRSDMVHWYTQYTEYDDVGAFFRPYRPSLLDAVTSA